MVATAEEKTTSRLRARGCVHKKCRIQFHLAQSPAHARGRKRQNIFDEPRLLRSWRRSRSPPPRLPRHQAVRAWRRVVHRADDKIRKPPGCARGEGFQSAYACGFMLYGLFFDCTFFSFTHLICDHLCQSHIALRLLRFRDCPSRFVN